MEGKWEIAVGGVKKKDAQIGECFQSIHHILLCPVTILVERSPSNDAH